VASVLAAAEDPQLGEDEVVERRQLRREDRREQVVDPEAVGQGIQRDLVDDDPDDPDEREFRRAEEGLEELPNPRPAACGGLLVWRVDRDRPTPRARPGSSVIVPR